MRWLATPILFLLRLRQIFQLYLKHRALLPVVQELDQRKWVNKHWLTLKNQALGGKSFTKTNLHNLLTNPLYVGQVTYKKELHAGEQEAIVEPDVWQKTQDLLAHNCRERVSPPVVKERVLLQGLLRCRNCGRAMTPATSSKKGTKKYRYYVCTSAQARGWNTCPSKSIPAAEIERFVVEQIRAMGQEELGRENPELVALDRNWDDLSPTEQGDILRSVIAEVAYDGVLKTVKVTVKDSVFSGNDLLNEEHAE